MLDRYNIIVKEEADININREREKVRKEVICDYREEEKGEEREKGE